MGSCHGCFTCSCHILVCGKGPLSILAEQTACGHVTTCSGSAGRVFVQPWTPQAPTLIVPLLQRRAPAPTGRKFKAQPGLGTFTSLDVRKHGSCSLWISGSMAETFRMCNGKEMQLDVCVPGVRAYLTTPDVFLSTEAAKLWVTPTRLVPSTSTIWSFTLILARPQTKAALISLIIPRSLTSTTAETAGRETNKAAYRFTLVVKLERRPALLRSQISTAMVPDRCITKRRKR